MFSDTVVPIAKTSMMFAEAVTKDIPADQFGRKPDGVNTNCPAWVIGHLGAYPGWVVSMLTGTAPPEDPETQAMFGHSSECKDDQAGTIYPSKDELLKKFNAGMQAVIDALPKASEAALSAPNPNEQMRDRFPTVGSLAAFMVGSHNMMHLGQISAWRRCMGLGPCM